MNRKVLYHLLAIYCIFFPSDSFSQIRLPRLISDGMVLQRDTEVKIWGWASPGEKVSVSFIDSIYKTEATPAGEWGIILE